MLTDTKKPMVLKSGNNAPVFGKILKNCNLKNPLRHFTSEDFLFLYPGSNYQIADDYVDLVLKKFKNGKD